jgi:hypothetical protein
MMSNSFGFISLSSAASISNTDTVARLALVHAVADGQMSGAAPSAVQNVIATDAHAVETPNPIASVSWAAPMSAGAAKIVQYRVSALNGVDETHVHLVPGTALSDSFSLPADGTQWTFQVVAMNSNGYSSVPVLSNALTFPTQPAPAPAPAPAPSQAP